MEQADKKIKNQNVETYAKDMAKAIESGSGRVIHEMIQEQEIKEEQEKNKSLASSKNKVFVVTSVLLVFIALIIFIFLPTLKDKVLSPTVEPKFVPVIFLDTTNFIDVSNLPKDKIASAVNNQKKLSEIKIGGVEGIYLTQNNKIVGFRELMNLISGNLPLDKATFLSDNYLIGITNIKNTLNSVETETEIQVQNESEKSLFILLQNRSMSDIFLAMKEWENKMFFDLHGFFGLSINIDTNYLLTKDFEDGIVQNKNARILRDNDGKIVLMYIYVNNTSVLITSSEDTTKEVITRLAASQIRK